MGQKQSQMFSKETLKKNGNIAQEDLCRYCEDIGMAEYIEHILCECPAITWKRQKMLGRFCFNNLRILQLVGVNELFKFCPGIQCF